jgi:hypothetical protein
VGMQIRRRKDIKEDRPCGHDEFRAAHGGYYRQSDFPSQTQSLKLTDTVYTGGTL